MNFISGKLNKMTYPVFADNNEEYMRRYWHEAVGAQGLPSTFVINKGRLIWAGHPAMLDRLMESFIDGTFDVQAFKKRHDQQRQMSEAAKLAADELQATIDKKDYEKALEMMDQYIAKSTGPYYKMQKFQLLVDHFESQKATAYLTELKNGKDNGAFEIARVVPFKDNLPKDIYLLSIDILRERPKTYDQVSRISVALSKSGKIPEAIKAQQEAVEMVKSALLSHKDDVLLEKEVMAYEERLKDLQKSAK